MTPPESLSAIRRAASLARKRFAPGTGRPPKGKRCACGQMSAKRAKQRGHKCHQVSPKHLHRYIDEFTFRLNEGDVKRHTMRRLESFIDAIVGKRLTYAALIAKVGA